MPKNDKEWRNGGGNERAFEDQNGDGLARRGSLAGEKGVGR